jgi:uncharacterized protein YbjT (DUF2867 family)
MNKTILVIGATGHQGRSVVRALKKHPEYKVRGLVRHAKKDAARDLARQGVEVVEGDLDNFKSLENAMKDVYGVFSYQGLADGVLKEEERGKRVAHVAKVMQVPHLLYSSVGGAERNTGISYFQSKYRVEEYIRELDLTNYTILRPVAFMENFTTGPKDVVLSFFASALKGKPVQLIAVADIGKWAAHIFSTFDAFMFQELEVAGDELTYDQIAAAYLRVEGKKPGSVPVLGSLLMGDMGKLYEWMRRDGYQADLELCRSTIKDSLTFEQWLTLKKRGEL